MGFKMKGFNYPGQSPLKQDKKKYTVIKNNSNLDKLKILVDKELSY